MDDLKASISLYIKHFTSYDYIAYGWLLATFVLLLILSILFIKKSPKTSLFLILLAFVLFFICPMFVKNFLDKTIRPLEVKNISYKKLHFSDTLILNWSIQNLSKNPYQYCQTTAIIYEPSKSKIKSFLDKLNPILSRTILEEKTINPNEINNDQLVLNNFNTNRDINISVKAECY
ncbi:MAG: DUF2393 family protein [Sulfurospirillaceae bacterium]|nr:DUF2393 family protein [Sulfurospirillaceae bacterium]